MDSDDFKKLKEKEYQESFEEGRADHWFDLFTEIGRMGGGDAILGALDDQQRTSLHATRVQGKIDGLQKHLEEEHGK